MNDFACRGSWSSPGTQPGSPFPESTTWDWTRYGTLLEERFGKVPPEITRPSMMARVTVNGGTVSRVSYIPCYLDDERAPEPDHRMLRDEPAEGFASGEPQERMRAFLDRKR